MTGWIILPSNFESEPNMETAIPVSSIVCIDHDWDNGKDQWGSVIRLRNNLSYYVDFTASEIAEFCVKAEKSVDQIVRCERQTPHDVGCPCGACAGDHEPSGISTVPQEAAALVEQILESARVPPAILGTKGMGVLPLSMPNGRRVPMAHTGLSEEEFQGVLQDIATIRGRAAASEPDEDVWMNPPPDAPKG